jgi:hypothetical protein
LLPGTKLDSSAYETLKDEEEEKQQLLAPSLFLSRLVSFVQAMSLFANERTNAITSLTLNRNESREAIDNRFRIRQHGVMPRELFHRCFWMLVLPVGRGNRKILSRYEAIVVVLD